MKGIPAGESVRAGPFGVNLMNCRRVAQNSRSASVAPGHGSKAGGGRDASSERTAARGLVSNVIRESRLTVEEKDMIASWGKHSNELKSYISTRRLLRNRIPDWAQALWSGFYIWTQRTWGKRAVCRTMDTWCTHCGVLRQIVTPLQWGIHVLKRQWEHLLQGSFTMWIIWWQ